ncbi:MAG: hypothetical protein KA392_10555 [Candidatus Obscuribacter sp.]|nr:hypothetical protein [Candidatus Obscuribacter sp.]MBP6592619.1 hypothetical protein [Candidatus Obscuribacter sp.]
MAEIKSSDQGDQPSRHQVETPALNSPEAQQVRNAKGELVESIKAANPDRSDGSATPKNRAGLYSQALIEAQDRSIELFDGDKVVAARVMDVAKPAPTAKETVEQQSKTIEELSEIAKHNPVFQPILGLRQHAEKLPPGEEKDKFIQLAKEQATDTKALFSQAGSQSEDQESCGSHIYETPLKGYASYPDQEIEGVRRLTPEDLRKLAKAFEVAGPAGEASIKEISDEILRRTGEASRDTLLAGIKAVCTVLEYDRDLVFNPAEARKKAAAAGEALGVLFVVGVQFTAGGIGYADRVRQSGDYSLPLKNISEGLNRWYERQSPADQMAIVAELGAGFGLASGAVAVNKLRKKGALIEFLKEGLDALPRNPEAERRAIQAVSKLFGRAEPIADTGVVVAAKATDVVKDAHDKGLGDHVMGMVKYFEYGKKKPISAEQAAAKAGVTKSELRQMTEEQLEARGLESIQKSYDRMFFGKYPQLKNAGVVVHHALPQKLLEKHPGLFKAKEVNSIEYLRGIPVDARKDGEWVHHIITARWEKFLPDGKNVSKQQILNELKAIDKEYGRFYVPPR